MDFEDEEFIKREQSDDLLFEAYDELGNTFLLREMKMEKLIRYYEMG